MVTNPNKAKGDRFEAALRDYLAAEGFSVDRTRAGYERDHGDLHIHDGYGNHRAIVQAKNVKAWNIAGWLRQLREQLAAGRGEHGVLVVKRPGVADPAQQYAIVEFGEYARLLRQAGYGVQNREDVA